MSENEILPSESKGVPTKLSGKMILVIIALSIGFVLLIALNMN